MIANPSGRLARGAGALAVCVGRLARVWDAWWGDERHIRRGGIVLLFNRGKFYGFSIFCIFFLEFSEKNRKFAIRYQLSQYFAMGKYINPFTSTCLFLSLTRRLKNVKVILTNGFMY